MIARVLAGSGLLALAVAVWAHAGGVRIEAYARDLLGAGARRLEQVAPNGPTRVDDLGALPRALRESSGVAASRAYAGVFWSNNDSGDGPRLYAVDTTAALVASVEVRGVRARDWEALDLGACPNVGPPTATDGPAAPPNGPANPPDVGPAIPPDGPSTPANVEPAPPWCLYIGDIGDNAGRRRAVRVHVVPEPDPRAAPESVEPLGTVYLSYAEGPTDAEALVVTPEGDLAVITKWGTPLVHEISAVDVRRSIQRGDTIRLGAGRPLPIRSSFILGGFPTGASLDADGSVLAVRTYADLHFFGWPLSDPPTEAAPVCFLGSLQPQGEAVALLPDGRALLSSESPGGAAGNLLAVACEGAGT